MACMEYLDQGQATQACDLLNDHPGRLDRLPYSRALAMFNQDR